MSELFAFGTLGFRHITDPRGADHILFLLALAAIYRFKDWRECTWVVTAFTLGHSVTLALAVTGAVVPAVARDRVSHSGDDRRDGARESLRS
jgi:hypothetical protein